MSKAKEVIFFIILGIMVVVALICTGPFSILPKDRIDSVEQTHELKE